MESKAPDLVDDVAERLGRIDREDFCDDSAADDGSDDDARTS